MCHCKNISCLRCSDSFVFFVHTSMDTKTKLYLHTNKPWGSSWQLPGTADSTACSSGLPTGRPLWKPRLCDPRNSPGSPGTSDGWWWEYVRPGPSPPSSAGRPGLDSCSRAGEPVPELELSSSKDTNTLFRSQHTSSFLHIPNINLWWWWESQNNAVQIFLYHLRAYIPFVRLFWSSKDGWLLSERGGNLCCHLIWYKTGSCRTFNHTYQSGFFCSFCFICSFATSEVLC